MRKLGLELLGGQTATVRFGQSQAVFLDVVAHRTGDLLDAVASGGDGGDHVHPVDVLHAGADHGGTGFLGDDVETVRGGRIGGPRVDAFLAGGDHADAASQALLAHGGDFVLEAE